MNQNVSLYSWLVTSLSIWYNQKDLLRSRLLHGMACRIPHNPIHRTIILRQHQIQEDADNSSNNKRRLDQKVDSLFEALKMDVRPAVVEYLAEPFWLHDINEADPESCRQDKAVSPREGD